MLYLINIILKNKEQELSVSNSDTESHNESVDNEEIIVQKQISSLNKNIDSPKNSFQNLARENKEFITNAKKMINIEKQRVEQSHAKMSEIIDQLIKEYDTEKEKSKNLNSNPKQEITAAKEDSTKLKNLKVIVKEIIKIAKKK